jgi:hypothetical protein
MSIKSLYHKLKFISLISVIGVLIFSCKKDDKYLGTSQDISMHHLTGDTAVMVGKWNWIYSDHQFNVCDPPLQYETVTPATEGFNFSIRFIKDGMVYLYQNNSLVAEYRLVFREFFSNSPVCESVDGSNYFIYLDGQEDKSMSGCIDYDTLMRTSFFGFMLREAEGCGYYNNFFVKE